jgi:hypothetical protein
MQRRLLGAVKAIDLSANPPSGAQSFRSICRFDSWLTVLLHLLNAGLQPPRRHRVCECSSPMSASMLGLHWRCAAAGQIASASADAQNEQYCEKKSDPERMIGSP